MADLRSSTIEGVNKFLKDQKKVKGKATITLAKFADTLSYIYENENLKEVSPLTRESYDPNGSTALLRAASELIDSTGIFLTAISEENRPSKVIFMIITDGQENASGPKYSRRQLAEKISHQRNVYNWEFVFLGANQDAITEAASYGIAASNAMNFAAKGMNVNYIYTALSENVSHTRGARGSALGGMQLNSTQRYKSMAPDVNTPVPATDSVTAP